MTVSGWGLGQSIGWALLHSIWQAGFLTVGLAVVLRLLPTSRVALRYRLALATMALAALTPLLTGVGLAADWQGHQTCREPGMEVAHGCSGHGRHAAVGTALSKGQESGVVDAPGRLGQLVRTAAVPGARLLPSSARRFARALTGPMAWIAVGWMAGLALATLGLARSLMALRRLWHDAVPIADGELRSALSDSLGRTHDELRVELRGTRDLSSPAVVWGRAGRILLPAGLQGLLDPWEIRAVFAHELAHLRGRDPWMGLAQAAACSVFFFNPFVPAISRMVDEEREALRDAQAVESLGSRRRYAEMLLALAGFQASRTRVGVLGLVGEGGLTRRIRHLGHRTQGARRAAFGGFVAGSLAMALVTLLVATAATAGTLSSWAVMVDATQAAVGSSATSSP